MIKLIIFDLDGVLVDTEEIHRESLLDAIRYITGKPRSSYEHLFNIDGRTTKEKLQILKKHLDLSELDIQLIDDKKQQNVIRYFFRPLRVSPNISLTIDTLSKEYKIAVASNSRKENVVNLLNIMGIASYFNMILSNNDVANPKPDPEIFINIMHHLEVLPEETLILEDSQAGKDAVKAARAHLFAIDDLEQVTLKNIKNEINRINTDSSGPDGGAGQSFFTSRL